MSIESKLNTQKDYESIIKEHFKILEQNLKILLNTFEYKIEILSINKNLEPFDKKEYEELNGKMRIENKLLFFPTKKLIDHISDITNNNKKKCYLKISKKFEFISLIKNDDSFFRAIGFKHLSYLFEKGELKTLMKKISQKKIIFYNNDKDNAKESKEKNTNL